MRPFETLTERGKARRHRETVTAALAEYGLTSSSMTQLAIDTNFVFRVQSTDGGRFALRIHRQGRFGQHLHEPSDSELECWWLARLVADGMPVAAVVPNRHGRYVTEVDGLPGVPGRQRCVLFHWLPGSHPDDRAQHYWYRLGHLAARLHQQAAGLDLPSWATPRRWDSVFPYEPNLLADERHGGVLEPSQRQVVERAIDALDPVMAERYRSPDRRPRLLHGDLHDENVLVCRGRLSVFDFEDLILGHPEHDLAVALYGPYYNRSDFDDVVATMRAGYEEVAPWPIEALDGLRPLFAARALGLANYCVSLGGHYLDYVAMLVERVEAYLDNPTDAAGATHDRPANDPAPAR